MRRMPSGGTIHIEDVQDQVELALMRSGEHKIARDYVIYREQQARKRAAKLAFLPPPRQWPTVSLWFRQTAASPAGHRQTAYDRQRGLLRASDVSEAEILDEALKNLYDGVTSGELSTSLVITARTMIEQEPNYTYVAARLLCDNLRSEALNFLGVANSATQHDMAALYAKALPAYIDRGIELELLAPTCGISTCNAWAKPYCRSATCSSPTSACRPCTTATLFTSDDTRIELPQIFFMRVAMGLAVEEPDKNARAIEFYELLSSFDYMSSTPTLFNAGTLRPQLSSCYLTTVPDDLHGIYGAIQDNAMLSKFAGGLGNDWTPVRALGAYIKGTNGKSQGVVPFLKVVNDTAVAVNQGGKRKGAVCAYLETWHLDIEEFVELRKNTGDDRRRTHDMNTANWIPDLFMKRVFEDGDWTLFSPNEYPICTTFTARLSRSAITNTRP